MEALKETGVSAVVDGAVIVTTPQVSACFWLVDITQYSPLIGWYQAVAIGDVRREITFCRKVGLKILGIIENMSGENSTIIGWNLQILILIGWYLQYLILIGWYLQYSTLIGWHIVIVRICVSTLQWVHKHILQWWRQVTSGALQASLPGHSSHWTWPGAGSRGRRKLFGEVWN